MNGSLLHIPTVSVFLQKKDNLPSYQNGYSRIRGTVGVWTSVPAYLWATSQKPQGLVTLLGRTTLLYTVKPKLFSFALKATTTILSLPHHPSLPFLLPPSSSALPEHLLFSALVPPPDFHLPCFFPLLCTLTSTCKKAEPTCFSSPILI